MGGGLTPPPPTWYSPLMTERCQWENCPRPATWEVHYEDYYITLCDKHKVRNERGDQFLHGLSLGTVLGAIFR